MARRPAEAAVSNLLIVGILLHQPLRPSLEDPHGTVPSPNGDVVTVPRPGYGRRGPDASAPGRLVNVDRLYSPWRERDAFACARSPDGLVEVGVPQRHIAEVCVFEIGAS
jgi:hypothetical protein